MQLEAAKHLAAILSEDERIINSKDPHFTHLFLVPESADPYAYVNSVLA